MAHAPGTLSLGLRLALFSARTRLCIYQELYQGHAFTSVRFWYDACALAAHFPVITTPAQIGQDLHPAPGKLGHTTTWKTTGAWVRSRRNKPSRSNWGTLTR